MREEYDFSQSIKNPYADRLRKPVTIRLGVDVIEYFERMSEETDVPYQVLINLYLKDCVQSGRRLSLAWVS
jgi:uncharacterized protein (DUF4415 family)